MELLKQVTIVNKIYTQLQQAVSHSMLLAHVRNPGLIACNLLKSNNSTNI